LFSLSKDNASSIAAKWEETGIVSIIEETEKAFKKTVLSEILITHIYMCGCEREKVTI